MEKYQIDAIRSEKRKLMHRLIKQSKNAADAEDIYQNAMLKICRFAGKKEFASKDHFRAWMFHIVVNEAINFFKYKQRKWGSIDTNVDVDIECGKRLSIESIDEETLLQILTETSDTLPPGRKEVFYMTYIQNLSEEEIANRMCIAQSTVRTRNWESRKKFKENIKKVSWLG
ncbi:hypothetical protein MHBO_003724 [Bonamia ostreae]|uniref:RNA polymerase sigma factor n=1 Tax=Bonamia ostreae TaxID=126728 RepID=A0ABV2ARB8_9EUKA